MVMDFATKGCLSWQTKILIRRRIFRRTHFGNDKDCHKNFARYPNFAFGHFKALFHTGMRHVGKKV